MAPLEQRGGLGCVGENPERSGNILAVGRRVPGSGRPAERRRSSLPDRAEQLHTAVTERGDTEQKW